MIQFEVECETRIGEAVAVLGSGPCGDWDLGRGLQLEPERYPIWTGHADASGAGPLEFKYAIVGTEGSARRLIRWETDGPNRRVDPAALGARVVVLHHVFGDTARSGVEVAQSLAQPDWEKSPSSSPSDSTATSLSPAPSPLSPAPVASLMSPPGSGSPAKEPRSRPRSRSPEPGERVLGTVLVEPSVRFGQFYHETGAFAENYDLREGSVLGTGMSGAVRVALCRKTGAQVAVKTLSTEGLAGEEMMRAIMEVENQLLLSHPNICRLLGVFEEPGQLRLVMERMRGPDLFEHISRKGRYTERDAAGCVKQMVSAVAYCHRHGVCHRDLKLENFCLEDASPAARVKLIDFGLSSFVEQSEPMTNACGTLYYVAPEVLSQSYGSKCDMWSLGVLTYILLAGRAPFNGKDDRATIRLIKQGRYNPLPEHLSEQAKDFVARLLEVDVAKRMDAEEALAHPWLGEAAAGEAPEPAPLEGEVLDSLRGFSRSNAVKRAVLRAIAPVATVERVATWADQFEALDTDGDGKVSIYAIAHEIAEHSGLAPAEAAELSRVLGEAEDGGEEVSYSAFLVACLTAHITLDDRQLRSLFDRLDTDGSGRVCVDKVRGALGDIVDVEELQAAFAGGALTYMDFRWLMSMPGHGPQILCLRQLLGSCGSLQSSWKDSTKRAKGKADTMEAVEAARRENMAWRVMAKQAQTGEVVVAPELAVAPKIPQIALSLASVLLGRGLRTQEQLDGMTLAEKRAVAIEEIVARGLGTPADLEGKTDDDLTNLCRPRSRAPSEAPEEEEEEEDLGVSGGLMVRTPTRVLVKSREDPKEGWQCAVAMAREGHVDAVRRENINWRKMQLNHKKAVARIRAATPEQ